MSKIIKLIISIFLISTFTLSVIHLLASGFEEDNSTTENIELSDYEIIF